MADFFSKMKKNLDKGVAIVSAKSNTLIETNKLKSEISTANKIKKDTLMAIGTKVYEEGKEGTFEVESVEALITKVSEQEAKVADLEAKIKLIQEEEQQKMDDLGKEEVDLEEAAEEVVVEAEEAVEEVVAEAEEVVEDLAAEAGEVAEEVTEEVEAAVEEVENAVEDILDENRFN